MGDVGCVQRLHDHGLVRAFEVPWLAPWLVIACSWLIAGFEYMLAVPANRIGAEVYSAAQLKTIQEVITLVVFVAFSWFYLA